MRTDVSQKAKNAADISRRQFCVSITKTAAVAGLGLGMAPLLRAGEKKRIPIALQMYTFRDQSKNDLPGAMADASKIGFKGVEFAGYFGHSAAEIRTILDDHGLVTAGTHTSYEALLGDKLKGTIEFNRVIGNRFVIVPWMTAESAEEWLQRAEQFNALAEKLQPEGMSIGYHAHSHDFKVYGETTAWDLFFGHTKKDVIMQLDTCNCRQGGADPVAVLKKYPGRARSIHLKPFSKTGTAILGEDDIRWDKIFDFCEGEGKTEWYVMEHETAKEPVEVARRTFERLKEWGKV